MTWSIIETEWDVPFSLRPFVFIFLILLLWLPYVLVSHYVLSAKFKRHLNRFYGWWRAKPDVSAQEQYIDRHMETARNPQIRGFYKAASDLITATAERSGQVADAYQAEIDYFLGKKESHLKALAIVLVFSLAGFLLMGLKRMIVDEIQIMSIVDKGPYLNRLLANLPGMFYHWIYFPLILALVETFVVFWLINSVKKLRLWLHYNWALMTKAVADMKTSS